MLAANLITFVALCVTALTVYLNWRSGNRRLDLDESQFADRLRHERVQHARGIAASTYARAWRLGESYRQSNAERLWVTSVETLTSSRNYTIVVFHGKSSTRSEKRYSPLVSSDGLLRSVTKQTLSAMH